MFENILKNLLEHQKAEWHPNEYRKAKLLVLFCLYSCVFSAFYIVISLLINFKAGAISQAITLVGFTLLAISHKIKSWSNYIRGTIFIIIGYQTIAILPMFSGGIEKHSIILPWLAVIPVAASLFTPPKQSWTWLIICVLTIIGYTFIPAEYTPITYNIEHEKIFSMLVYIGLVLILLLINLTFKRSEEIALEKLDSSNSKILSSIRYAKLIQKVVLPSSSKRREIFTNQFSIIKAKDVVSGDFIWVKKIDTLDFWALVDCTGHGVPGAFITFVINNLLNEITEAGNTDPGKILSILHQKVENQLNSLTNQNKEGCDISLCVFDSETNILKFAGARRPLIKIQNNEIEKFSGNRCSIGGVLTEKHINYQFSSHIIPLSEKCILYMFSDGITDQFKGDSNSKYTERRLISFLNSVSHLNLTAQRKLILNEIETWQDNSIQIDDICLFAVSPDPNNQLNLKLNTN